VRLSPEDDIQENIRVKEDTLHQYLAARCLRYSSR
jgi:hypothetical protein